MLKSRSGCIRNLWLSLKDASLSYMPREISVEKIESENRVRGVNDVSDHQWWAATQAKVYLAIQLRDRGCEDSVTREHRASLHSGSGKGLTFKKSGWFGPILCLPESCSFDRALAGRIRRRSAEGAYALRTTASRTATGRGIGQV